MKQEKIIITILCALLLLLGGYIVYDKVLSNNNKNSNNENVTTDNNVTNEVNDNKEKEGNTVVESSNSEEKVANSENTNNTTSNEPTYTVKTVTAVYENQEKQHYLTLWDDGTFSYNKILGNYYIEGNTIYLNHLFINNNNLESTKGKTILTINSSNELYNKQENILLII